MNECEKWLHELLRLNGRSWTVWVYEQAKEKGFKKSEVKAAKKSLSVKTWHQFDEGTATENWFWYLPENSGSNG
jgi:hypothetical protein